MTTILVPVEIPLTPQPQKFTIDLNGVTYNMRIVWNHVSQLWVLDILDINSAPLVCGLPLAPGVNMLGQFDYLGMNGAMTCMTDVNAEAPPTFENLGLSGHLYFIAYQLLVETVNSSGSSSTTTTPGNDGNVDTTGDGTPDSHIPTPIHPGSPGST